MHYVGLGAVGAGAFAYALGESFRLTPGALTLMTLAVGFATAVLVAYINTRPRDEDERKEQVSLPLERWAAERMELQDVELRELREENRQLKEKLWLSQRRRHDDETSGTSS